MATLATQTVTDVNDYMLKLGVGARAAATELARADTARKNQALSAIAAHIDRQQDRLITANQRDLDAAANSGLAASLRDRLQLTPQRISAMASGLRQVAALPDPVGEVSALNRRPSGLRIGRMRVPLGVVGIIYESRPNVTADAAALCLKSGNATILRGGSEALHSNQAIAECISEGLREAELPEAAVQVVATTDRAAVGALITMEQYVDIVVPRGGRGLIERIARDATVAVIKHLDGVCHVYVDQGCDHDMALRIAFNAKTYRYGICGAMETLLVARSEAGRFLPAMVQRFADHGVEVRGCDDAARVVPGIVAASEDDWYAEYLAPIIAIKVVDDIDAAMAHIRQYGSQHTDAIVTKDLARAERFLAQVDSSSVMVNAPTCFADGFEYGLGAEIGISTNKLHARGPVGLEGLTTQKFIVLGDGQTR